MPRRPRFAQAGYVFHVLNRGAGRQTLFESNSDYDASEFFPWWKSRLPRFRKCVLLHHLYKHEYRLLHHPPPRL